MRKIITLFGSLLLAGCAHAKPAPLACSAASFYFTAEVDQFNREWYESDLRAMKEPSLSCGEQNAAEQYRFLWLRSFHHPIAVRIGRTDKGIVLEAVELDGAGGYEPGKISKRVKKTLNSREWDELKRKLQSVDFWNVPAADELIGNDGAQWIVEGRKDSAYHMVDRWGGYNDNYRNLGLFFLKLSGFVVPENEIY